MTLNSTTNWVFPIKVKDGQGKPKKVSVSALYRALAQAKSGFYPIGLNQLWHGGIHVDSGVLSQLGATSTSEKLGSVHYMTDGEVIAYRIDENYNVTSYQNKNAFYSRNFVLVRHLLQMDYLPPLLKDRQFEVISGKDTIKQGGVNVRDCPGKTKIGYLLNGAKITIDPNEEHQTSTGFYWYPLVSVNEKHSSIPKLGEREIKTPDGKTLDKKYLGWVSLGKNKIELAEAEQTIANQNDKLSADHPALAVKGINVYESASSNNEILSLLPIGCKLKLSEVDTKGVWGKVAALEADSYSSTPNVSGWVNMKHIKWIDNASEEDKKPHQLYLYSLYMHLADMAYYQSHPDAICQYYWPTEKATLKADKTVKIKGIRIRKTAKSNEDNVLAILEKGVKIKVQPNTKCTNTGNWVYVESIDENYHVFPALSPYKHKITDAKNKETEIDILGWIFLKRAYFKTLDEKAGIYQVRTDGDSDDVSKGILVFNETDDVMLSLSPDCELKLGSIVDGEAEVIQRLDTTGKQTQPFPQEKCYVNLSDINIEFKKDFVNQVNVLETPYPVKSGDILGHIGHYHVFAEALTKSDEQQAAETIPNQTAKQPEKLPPDKYNPLLHVELFTCGDLSEFINKTKTEALKTEEKNKTLVYIETGAKLVNPSPADTTEKTKDGDKETEQIIKGDIPANTNIMLQDEDTGMNWLKVKTCYYARVSLNTCGLTLDTVKTKQTLDNQTKLKAELLKVDGLNEKNLPKEITVLAYCKTDGITTDINVAKRAVKDYVDIEVQIIPTDSREVWVEVDKVDLATGRKVNSNAVLSSWVEFPLKENNTSDMEVGYASTLSLKVLNDFKREEKARDNEKGLKRWWKVTLGSKTYQEITGWVCEQQDKVKLGSPWEWFGYERIEEKSTLKEGYASVDKLNYYQQANEADYKDAPLVGHLINALNTLAPAGSEKNTISLTDKFLRKALGHEWFARQLSHLLVKYESEWYSELTGEKGKEKMPKWEALDEILMSELLAYKGVAEGQLSKEEAQEMAEKHFAHLDLSPETKSKYQQNIADTIKMIYSTVEQSEHGGAKAQEDLSKLMTEISGRVENWEKEKARIQTMLWWKAVEQVQNPLPVVDSTDANNQNIATDGAPAESDTGTASDNSSENQSTINNQTEAGQTQSSSDKITLQDNTTDAVGSNDETASNHSAEKDQGSDSDTKTDDTNTDNKLDDNNAEPKAPVTTLSKNGQAWFLHPVEMIGNFGTPILFRRGDKHKLIQEMNIRLTGFGGNVPTDKFDKRTEKAVKQFQRDYMKVEATGLVSMKELEAIDRFTSNPAYSFNFNQIKCKCETKGLMTKDVILNKNVRNTCQGFGDNIASRQFFERPGIHRSVVFALKALLFYFEKNHSDIKFSHIESGYRCRFHSEYIKSKTRNHMGDALDLHFSRNGVRTKKESDMDKIRKDYFCDYMNAPYDEDPKAIHPSFDSNSHFRWERNRIGLEGNPIQGNKGAATTWVHFDVRDFHQYKLDAFYIKQEKDLMPLSMVELYKKT